MKKTKVKTTPVVEKKETVCSCGDSCSCGEHCSCGCEKKKTLLKCGTMLVSAAIIAASIVMTSPDCPFAKRGSRNDRRPMAGAQMNEAGFREFIMNNPKVLIDSVDAYYKQQQVKQKPAQPAPADLVEKIVNDKTNYSLGNPNGKFVIIEFFDYNCGYCKRTNTALSEVVKSKEGANIRWIPIDTPIFGESSEIIARYVLAAGKQGKYAEMHDAVSEAKGRVDEAALIEMGKKLKLDTKKLTADAKGKEINDKLVANREFIERLKINGVPMLIVDGKINPGALFGEKLDEVVKASQKKK